MKDVSVPIVRTSERSDFMRCEQKWQWAYVDRLRGRVSRAPLVFGDLIHRSLAEYYLPETSNRRSSKEKPKRGAHPCKTFEKIYRAEDHDFGWGDSDHYVDAFDLGMEMLTNYIDEYGLDSNLYIIAPEMPFQVPIYGSPSGKKQVIAYYVGTLDALMRYLPTGQYGFLETKTAKTISKTHLGFDEQAGSYWTYGPQFLRHRGYLRRDEDIDFIMYNFLRKGFSDKRPENENGQKLNKDGTISKTQPSPLFGRHVVRRAMHERRMLHQRVTQQIIEMDKIRVGKREPIKSILNGCVGMYSCQFREMCELQETGDDWEGYRDATMDTWEPYEIHDRSDDGLA